MSGQLCETLSSFSLHQLHLALESSNALGSDKWTLLGLFHFCDTRVGYLGFFQSVSTP